MNVVELHGSVVAEGNKVVDQLADHHKEVDKALRLLSAPFDAEQLIQRLRQLLSTAKGVQQKVDPLRERFGHMAYETGRQVLCGSFIAVGLSQQIPRSLLQPQKGLGGKRDPVACPVQLPRELLRLPSERHLFVNKPVEEVKATERVAAENRRALARLQALRRLGTVSYGHS